ncbi:MAG: hypothetical protein LBF24_02095, partial [Puniceicoccales bacterium]|nr:hypothetical protein [Puniceicoccales bacterium]
MPWMYLYPKFHRTKTFLKIYRTDAHQLVGKSELDTPLSAVRIPAPAEGMGLWKKRDTFLRALRIAGR